MTSEQFSQLLAALMKLSDRPYTLTGAADWPMLVFLVGGLGAVALSLIGVMWLDLRAKISDDKLDNKEEHTILRKRLDKCEQDLKDCKDKCCGGN